MSDATPLADRSPLLRLVRGQPFRRPSATDLIAASALPVELRSLVADVVRRAGGRRGERAEIARELLAHFDDALRRGQPLTDTIANFGDPATTAKLLRRAMLRKRGPIWKSLRWAGRGALAAALLLAVGYGIAFARFHASKPVISFDALAHLRELAPRGEERERAWPILRDAIAPLRTEESKFYAAERDSGTQGDLFVRGSHERGWSEAAGIVARQRTSLDAIRSASRLPLLGAGIEEFDDADRAYFGEALSSPFDPTTSGLLFVRLPYLAELRRAARWLGVDADHALLAGDSERFVADVRALFDLGRLTRGPLLVDQLVSAAILAIAFERTLDGIARHPDLLDATTLADLAEALDMLPDELLRLDFRGERSMMIDFVQRVYTDDGAGDGHLVAHAIDLQGIRAEWGVADDPQPMLVRAVAPIAALAAPSRREFTDHFDRAVAAAERRAALPTWEWTAIPPQDPFHREIAKLFGLDALIPRHAYAGAVEGFARLAHRRRLARLGIALASYRVERGAWPTSLDPLVPDFIDEIPADPYDGMPLRYALLDGQASVWTIGPDRIEHGPIEDEAYTLQFERRWQPPGPPELDSSKGWPAADIPLWKATVE